MSNLQVIRTEDGSPSLWNPDLEEGYHSKFGALQESMHVFIQSGLKAVDISSREMHILEIGLGTALNAVLTVSHMESDIHYYGLEPFPVDLDILKSMNFGEILSEKECAILDLIWNAPTSQTVQIAEGFRFEKLEVGLNDFDTTETRFDLIYFDAFAPEVQPDLWQPPVFEKLFNMTEDGGVMVTYCAKGKVRRAMIEAGFVVERLPGPPGKRHMLRAKKG